MLHYLTGLKEYTKHSTVFFLTLIHYICF